MANNKLSSKTLNQILEVIKKSKSQYISGSPIHTSIQTGIDYVSKSYKVTYQTIEDGCRRRLNLKTIDDFRRMLSEYFNGNPKNIISILREHTDVDLHNKINEFFKGNVTSFKKTSNEIRDQSSPKQIPEQTTEVFSFRLDEETSKRLKVVSGYREISPSEWISKNIKRRIDEDIEELFKLLMGEK